MQSVGSEWVRQQPGEGGTETYMVLMCLRLSMPGASQNCALYIFLYSKSVEKAVRLRSAGPANPEVFGQQTYLPFSAAAMHRWVLLLGVLCSLTRGPARPWT